jgi:DNA-binding transcriptional MerR regulator
LERAPGFTVPGVAERKLTIAQAAAESGVSPDTLRYYERIGLLDPIDRGENGHRRYGEEDLARVHFLTRLRSTGMPIRRLRELAKLARGGDETHAARLALLEEHRDAVRSQLAETERSLDLIERKIDTYRERLAAR